MRFVLDEDVSHALAGLLRSHRYDADSAKELGRLGLTDVQVLPRATDDGRTVITKNNKDFRALREAWISWRGRWAAEVTRAVGTPVALSSHAGILIVPQRPDRDLARIIDEAVADANDAISDRLFAWSAAAGWHEIRI